MNRIVAIIALCFLFACQSEQEAQLNRINKLQTQLVDDNLKTDRLLAQELADEMESYIGLYTDSTVIADYYMQLGDLYTQALNLPIKGLYYFQKVTTDFPSYKKASVALFYQGFILENYLQKQEQAKIVYEQFLVEYPDHELAETVRLSIQQIGIPLEDLIKQFEATN